MMKKIILLALLIPLLALALPTQAAVVSYLSVGWRGAQVMELQTMLAGKGFYNGPVTGYFGQLTRNAVMQFQAANQIPAIGIVGPLTRARLNTVNQNLSIANLSPSFGLPGAQIAINGYGFTQNSTVYFDNQAVTPVFISPNNLIFTVPSSISPTCRPGAMCAMYIRMVTPGNYNVRVFDGTSSSNTVTFTVTDANTDGLSVNSITPAAGPIGTQITITGSGFAAGDIVDFGNGFISKATVVNSDTIMFTVPSVVMGGCRYPMMCPNYIIPVTPQSYAIDIYRWTPQGVVRSNTINFTVTTGSVNQPIISGVSGPVTLGVNQTGTWSISATDASNGSLSYSVVWGDEGYYNASQAPSAQNSFTQQTTFSHAYSHPGNYTIQFSVKNNAGGVATSTITVNIH
jgi:peptidoglycan hydrolase-like protein with peptidoglycan-binding domain